MTAKTAPANAAAPITAAVFLLRFFFTALQISMAQTTQTAATASAITSVSHNHESSYNILIRSPYLSLANWKLLFHIHAFAKSRFIPLLSPPLRFWVFQQVRLLRNPFQPLSFFLRQLPIVQLEPLQINAIAACSGSLPGVDAASAACKKSSRGLSSGTLKKSSLCASRRSRAILFMSCCIT